MIAKIISGGQTGVDVAALRGAKKAKVPTGGMMPRGFRTLAGPKPEWAAEFGLVDTSDAYPPRTGSGRASDPRRPFCGRGSHVIVNFAGNSEKTAPGIEAYAEGLVRIIIEATYG